MKKQIVTNLLLAVAILACTSVSAFALLFTSNTSNIYLGDTPSGNFLSATADFTVVGDQLKIVLTNTGDPASQNIDVLMGVFFSVTGDAPFVTQGSSSATASQLINAPGGVPVSGTNVSHTGHMQVESMYTAALMPASRLSVWVSLALMIS